MRRLVLPLLSSCLLLTACGSDDESAPAAVEGNRVGMKDLQFEPKDITVKAGEKITWVNEESVPHNVVNTQEGQQPKSELFNEGGTYAFTPTKAGKISYVCTIHPGMEGSLDVVEG